MVIFAHSTIRTINFIFEFISAVIAIHIGPNLYACSLVSSQLFFYPHSHVHMYICIYKYDLDLVH